MPFDIQDPGLLRAIRQAYKLQTPAAFVLDRVVSPVTIVGDLREGPQEIHYGLGAFVAPGGATQRSVVQLYNPPGSGVLVRPTDFSFRPNAGMQFAIVALDQALSASVARGRAKWRRAGPSASGLSQAEVRTGYQPAIPDNAAFLRDAWSTNNSYGWRPIDGFILEPGTGLALQAHSDDESIRGTWGWTEFRPERGPQ